jgi:hypothetical protein
MRAQLYWIFSDAAPAKEGRYHGRIGVTEDATKGNALFISDYSLPLPGNTGRIDGQREGLLLNTAMFTLDQDKLYTARLEFPR